MPNNLFKNCRVLITGGSGRLGSEIVMALISAGARVAVHYYKKVACHPCESRDLQQLNARDSRSPLTTCGDKFHGNDSSFVRSFKADIRDVSQIEKTVVSTVKSLGGLDVLINSAALFYKTPLVKTTEDEWNDLLNVNLRAPFFFAKFCAPFLKHANPGRIINIADTYGRSPAAGFVPYGVSKAGLIAMTKGLAKELAPKVLVNCVCPNVIKTTDARRTSYDEKAIGATLLKRAVEVEDVINAVLFLATNNSMTGQTIFVDGGKNV